MYSVIDIVEFANDVKANIKKLHLTQEMVAKNIAYSRKSLNKILNNPTNMTVEVFNVLCKTLNIVNIQKYIKTINL